jgi:hypothetical protein
MIEYESYNIMRQYFLKNPQYTHMVIVGDDITVEPRHIARLLDDLEDYDVPIISGMMNVEENDNRFRNLTLGLPAKDPEARRYEWITREQLTQVEPGLMRVSFSGFPLMAIRRDVVEKLGDFVTDAIYRNIPVHTGNSIDLTFAWFCAENDIPIYADNRIDLKHYRNSGLIMNGIKPKEFIIIRKC